MADIDIGVGERLARRRRERGLTRRAVAELVGRSDEWLRQIENGAARLDSIEVLVRLADILHLPDFRDLIDVPPPRHSAEAADDWTELRAAILDHPIPADPPDSPIIGTTVEELWEVWWHGSNRYSAIRPQLPGVVRRIRRQRLLDTGPDLAAQTVATYHLARSVLGRIGERNLGYLVADRGMQAATHHCAQQIAVAQRNLAMASLQAGEHAEAARHSEAAIRIVRDRAPLDGDDLVALGSLIAILAKARARRIEPVQARSALAELAELAAATGADRQVDKVWFGTCEAELVQMHVELTLGNPDRVIRQGHETTDAAGDYPVNMRFARDALLANAYARRKDDASAVLGLLRIERIAPQELRYDRSIRHTLGMLLRRDRPSVRAEVGRMARIAEII